MLAFGYERMDSLKAVHIGTTGSVNILEIWSNGAYLDVDSFLMGGQFSAYLLKWNINGENINGDVWKSSNGL